MQRKITRKNCAFLPNLPRLANNLFFERSSMPERGSLENQTKTRLIQPSLSRRRRIKWPPSWWRYSGWPKSNQLKTSPSSQGHEFVAISFHMPASCEACTKPLWAPFRPPPAVECRSKDQICRYKCCRRRQTTHNTQINWCFSTKSDFYLIFL